MRQQEVQAPPGTKRLLLALLAAGALLPALAVGDSGTSGWPQRPIRLVVPFQAGGAADMIARLLGASLAPILGQPVVIENRVGAGGVVGAQSVAQAPADGHTLGLATQSTHAANPAFNPRVPYDPVRDFAPISMVAMVPGILAVHPSVPAESMEELLALARRKPRELSYGTPGIGSLGHLLIAQIEARFGLELLHVPYKSGAAALADASAGRLHIVGDTLPAALPLIREGRLKAIAVMAGQRLPLLPEVPTFAELDMAEIGQAAWFGLVAPAGTPAAVIARLSAAVGVAMHQPEMAAALARSGGMPASGTPEDFAQAISTTLQAYRTVVAVRGIRPE